MQCVTEKGEMGTVDIAWLSQNVGGNRGLVCRLLAMFDEAMSEATKKIRQSVRTGDRETLLHAAHGLKGTAATMGAVRVHAVASGLNDAAKEEPVNQLNEWIKELDAVCGQARVEIRAFLESEK